MKANYEEKIQEQPVSGNLNLSLYELNKSAVRQLPDYTDKDFSAATERIEEYVKNDKFFMLLGREFNYYTLFMREPSMEETISEAVIDCLKNIGPIKSIEQTQGESAIEIWVMVDDEPIVMYFFCYNEGVIICR